MQFLLHHAARYRQPVPFGHWIRLQCKRPHPEDSMEVIKSARLVNALRFAISRCHPTVVIETGTFLGKGSTRIILDAFEANPPEKFYTVEISGAFARLRVRISRV
jgi:predicted O-methyltransferase YrrM